jgi:hypothetical protein
MRLARRLPHLALAMLVLSGVARASGEIAVSSPTTNDWRVSPPAAATAIAGYADSVSVAPGERLALHVSTAPAARYRIELYRIGWTGGAGGELVACIPDDCVSTSDGSTQPTPEPRSDTGELRAGWRVTDTIAVPADWRSGEYRAKLVLASGPDAGRSVAVPFVVREPTGAAAAILVVVPVNTWQAYNDWGGRSTYTDPNPAVKVSFDRPYANDLVKPWLGYPVARFLDRFGYDVAYTTDVDVDRARAELTRHRVVIVTGHAEYWTKEERDGLEAARGLGVHLVFLSGNTGYWQVRYADPERRVLELWRDAARDPSANPRQKTVRWRDAPLDRPECALLGVQWQGGDDASDPTQHPYTVTAEAAGHPWFRGSGLRAGDTIAGAVGKEWDAIAPECATDPQPLTSLLHYEGRATPEPPGVWRSSFHSTDADAVTYTAPSGAVIFSAGSIGFAWTLAPVPDAGPPTPETTDPETPADRRVQRVVRTMLDDLVTRAPPAPVARERPRGR